MAKFAVGDVVVLQQETYGYPKGTSGVVARVDNDGWIKVTVDDRYAGRFIMIPEWHCVIKKVEEDGDE